MTKTEVLALLKFKGKKAPDDDFFMEHIQRIQNSIQSEEDMWVRESMNGALMGIGKRNRKLNSSLSYRFTSCAKAPLSPVR